MDTITEKIKSLEKSKNKISINLIPWNDYHYFKELCIEDGGVIDKYLDIYNNLNNVIKIKNVKELIDEIKKCDSYPYLHSNQGKVKLFYDLHIWINNYYIIYNPYHKKFYYKKMTFIDYLFHPVRNINWAEKNN